ncbi:MAG: divalent-cation tolerance protein CutA [Candidatus Omnitrophica bacterium]|nr:divalent-cation tolerance protein CutA [Candidatus Omnitrophota bacterium]
MDRLLPSSDRIILITASSIEEARRLAESLLQEHLAACVNCIPELESHYWWRGKLEHASESLLIVKTTAEAVSHVIRRVKELHSYSTPEIISCTITEGSKEYLKWLRDSVKVP